MFDFLAFLQDYYWFIVLVLVVIALVLEIVLCLVKVKNPSILSAIDKVLPEVILDAENRFSDGHDKLQYVILTVENTISSMFNIKNVKQYDRYIKSSVEKILSCPQKKEVL